MADDIAAQCVIVQAMWKSAYQACAGVAVQHPFNDQCCWGHLEGLLFAGIDFAFPDAQPSLEAV